jgi:hypothetical protein
MKPGYKVRLAPAPFRTPHSPAAAENLSLASHVSDERLLLDFSATDSRDLPRLTEVLWSLVRGASFSSDGLSTYAAFRETRTLEHSIEILLNPNLAPHLRMGAVSLLSTVFPDLNENEQSMLSDHRILCAVNELAFSELEPRAIEFLSQVVIVSSDVRDDVLTLIDIPSVLELVEQTDSDMFRQALVQLIAFLCYFPLDDEFAQPLIECISAELQTVEPSGLIAEKFILALYYLASAGRVDLILSALPDLDIFPAVLERGSKRAVKISMKLLNLFVDVSDAPLQIDWTSLINGVLSPAKSTAVESVNLIEVLLTKSRDYFRVLSPKKLLSGIAIALEEQSFFVRVRVIFFLQFLATPFPEIAGAFARAQILQKIDFQVIEPAAEEAAPLITIVSALFANCADPGLLISFWNQFCFAHGPEWIDRLAQDADANYLAQRAVALRETVAALRIEELPDVGEPLLPSSDDEVVDGDPFGLNEF